MVNAHKNLIASLIHLFLTMLSSLILHPQLFASLGSVYFGLLKTFQKVLELISCLDGGSVQSLKWKTAHSVSDRRIISKHLFECRAILKKWSKVMLLAVMFFGIYSLYFLELNELKKTTVSISLFILGGVYIFSLRGNLYESILVGLNKAYVSYLIRIIILTISTLILYTVSRLTSSIEIILMFMALGSLFLYLALKRFGKRQVVAVGSEHEFIKTKLFQRGYSSYVWQWEIIQKLIFSVEILVLAAVSKYDLLTSYLFMFFAYQFAFMALSQTISSFTPKIASLLGSGDNFNANRFVKLLDDMSVFFILEVSLIILLFNESFLNFWISEDMFISDAINSLICISFIQTTILRLQSQIIDTTLKIEKRFKWGLISFVATFLLGLGGFLFFENLIPMLIGIIVGKVLGIMAFGNILRGFNLGKNSSRVRVLFLVFPVVIYLLNEYTSLRSGFIFIIGSLFICFHLVLFIDPEIKKIIKSWTDRKSVDD